MENGTTRIKPGLDVKHLIVAGAGAFTLGLAASIVGLVALLVANAPIVAGVVFCGVAIPAVSIGLLALATGLLHRHSGVPSWWPSLSNLVPMVVGIAVAALIFFFYVVKPGIDAAGLDTQGVEIVVRTKIRYAAVPMPDGDLTKTVAKMGAVDNVQGIRVDGASGDIFNGYGGTIRLVATNGDVHVEYSNVPPAVCKSLKFIRCM